MVDFKNIRALPFPEAVHAMTRKIPRGKVLGYGHLAALLGHPRRARHVGFALSSLPAETTVPWWRVLRSNGSIALQGDPLRGPTQQQRLRTENVPFRGQRVDMRSGRWEPELD